MISKIDFGDLEEKLGPIIGGRQLAKQLGFKTTAAFNRAVRLKRVGVEVFSINRRRGTFAYTKNVIAWLETVGTSPECERFIHLQMKQEVTHQP